MVANEVRSLAGRSAASAKETAEMVAEVHRRIEAGEEATNRTRDSFAEIARAASEAADQVRAIVEASREQAEGLEQTRDRFASNRAG